MLHQVVVVAAALAGVGGIAIALCFWLEDRRGQSTTAANAHRGGFPSLGDG